MELLFYAIGSFMFFIQETALQTSPEMMKLDGWIAPYRADFQGFMCFFPREQMALMSINTTYFLHSGMNQKHCCF